MQCDMCGEQREEAWYTLTQFAQSSRQPDETVYCDRCLPSTTLTPDQLCLICRTEPVDPQRTLRVRFAANRIIRLQLLCGAACRAVADQQLRAMMAEIGVHDANEQKENTTEAAIDDPPVHCSACKANVDDGSEAVFTTTLFALLPSVEGDIQRVCVTLCSNCLPHIPLPPNRHCLTCADQPVDDERTLEVSFVHLRMVVRKEVCGRVECRLEQEREMHEQLDEDGLYREEQWREGQEAAG